jgi:hypothetical protein
MRRMLLRGCVGLCLITAASVTTARADEWRPVGSRPAASSTAASAPVTSSRSPVGLGAPITSKPSSPVSQTAFSIPLIDSPAGVRVRGQGPDMPMPGSAEEQFNSGVVTEGPPAGHGPIGPGAGAWWDNCGDYMIGQPCRFMSDHDFDSFISPISNPFFFEDPRSLTEIRPIFMWQKIPGSNPLFQGGNAQYLGVQARLALTERWSIVLHKIGGIWFQPDAPFFGDEAGISELQIGPKFTFYRDPGTQTIAAFGVNFEFATGSQKVFQNTGDGAITPYVTAGQKIGNFHVIGAFGYRFRVDDTRSNSFFTSLHIDYSIFEKIYPLVELNWYHYTQNGRGRAADFEGQDLFNFGSNNVEGNDVLTLAAGVRYKISEAIQAGIVAEFPLLKREDLLDFRITADLIFRY